MQQMCVARLAVIAARARVFLCEQHVSCVSAVCESVPARISVRCIGGAYPSLPCLLVPELSHYSRVIHVSLANACVDAPRQRRQQRRRW
jgi:hypothetical protein